MLLDSILRGVRDLRSRRRGAAGGKKCPSRAQGRLLRCEHLEDRQLLSLAPAGIDWATYLGGGATDGVAGVAIDRDGSALVAGNTTSADVAGANYSYHGGSFYGDAFVAKVNTDGSLAWFTYLGGSGDDLAYSVAVDGAGNAFVTGTTFSTDFAGANSPFHGGTTDDFVAKVNSDGTLAWATYLGGGGREGNSSGIAVDGAGNAFVAGQTRSLDFDGAINSHHGGTEDGYVAKVNGNDGTVAWSIYLGGTGWDVAKDIAIDGAGNLVVAGSTNSADLSGANNAIHGTVSFDPFVAKVTGSGSLVWATYLGGTNTDESWSLALDGAGNAFVTGTTFSTDFEGANNTYHGAGDPYVAKVTSAGSLAWATYLGGSHTATGAWSFDAGNGIAVDGAGNVLVSGRTNSADFPGMIGGVPGADDAFVAKVTTAGSLAWATQIGGSGTEIGYAMAIDGAGNAFMTGYTTSTDFAGATNGYQGGTQDAIVVKLDPAVYDASRFYVVNDATLDQTFEYQTGGAAAGSYGLGTGNTAPRGVATTTAGDKTWVVDANRNVYVYDTSGTLLGSWTAGTLASNADVQDITVFGNDVWIVDAKSDKVYRYSGAATRLKDSQNAASSFSLNSGNKDPKGMVTDGTSLWVVNDSWTDKLFKYTLSGSLVGSWTISTSGAASPTGLTIDPTGASQDIWIVDSGTDKVYQYANARSRTSGSQSAAATFALAAGNTNPQGIADPPPPGSMLATGRRAAASLRPEAAAIDYLMSDLADRSRARRQTGKSEFDLLLAEYDPLAWL
jgi:hypothetical protein